MLDRAHSRCRAPVSMAGRSDDGVAQPGAAGLPAPHARRRCADRERLSGRHQYPRQQLRETGSAPPARHHPHAQKGRLVAARCFGSSRSDQRAAALVRVRRSRPEHRANGDAQASQIVGSDTIAGHQEADDGEPPQDPTGLHPPSEHCYAGLPVLMTDWCPPPRWPLADRGVVPVTALRRAVTHARRDTWQRANRAGKRPREAEPREARLRAQ